MKLYDINQKARPSPSPIAFKLGQRKRKEIKKLKDQINAGGILVDNLQQSPNSNVTYRNLIATKPGQTSVIPIDSNFALTP